MRHLVVLPGTARRPDGDALQFDLDEAGANAVFRAVEAVIRSGET